MIELQAVYTYVYNTYRVLTDPTLFVCPSLLPLPISLWMSRELSCFVFKH